ncbi:MAG: hypothetical protein AB7F99_01130 [Vicinamibacterales bacterium]
MTRQRTATVAFVAILWFGGCSPPASSTNEYPPGEAESETVSPDLASRRGHVVTGRAPVSAGVPSIVILEPQHTSALPEPTTVPYMDQISRTFIPPILFVRTGHPAEFRNSDEEMHNINVTDFESRTQIFNVAVPLDETYVHRFESTGLFDVSCDVHPGMSAQIVATSTPYMKLTDAEGRFEFPDVVPGAYVLVAYGGGRTVKRPLQVSGTTTDIDVSSPQEPTSGPGSTP